MLPKYKAMNFALFLNKYYSHNQQVELLSLLDKLNIFRDIESAFNNFYLALKSKNQNEIISKYSQSTRDIVTCIVKSIKLQVPLGYKAKKIAVLTANFIRDTYMVLDLEFPEFFNLLVKSVKSTCLTNSFSISVFEKLLNRSKVNALVSNKAEKGNDSLNNTSKPLKLDWQGKKHLDLFVDDLTKTFYGIKCRKQLYRLFDNLENDFKVELPSKYLVSFITLFYDLHKTQTIKVAGNRGLFVYLRQHLQAPLKEYYPKRDFRKLRHEASKKNNTRLKVDSLIKPLLDKYCIN